jgi:hypothetical protein
MSLTVPPEAVYLDVNTATASIQVHAKEHGYAFCQCSTRSNRLVFACDRAGKYNSKGKDPNTHSSRQRQSTGSKKCGCLMKVELRLGNLSNQWSLRVPPYL